MSGSTKAFCLLLLATGCLYLPLRRARFVYDDQWLIVRNAALRSIRPVWFFTDPRTVADPTSGLTSDIYRPLTVLSFAVDYHLWGLRPVPYHLENLFWHATAALLFWALLRQLLRHETAALVGAAVFLWHPVQVQTVAWVSQRSNVLSACALLASLGCFLRLSEKRRLATTTGCFFYLLALLSKESAIVLPGVLLLIDWNYRRENLREKHAIIRYGVLVLMSAGYLLFRHSLLHQWSQFAGETKNWSRDIALASLALPVYIGKLLLPFRLRPSYDYPVFRFPLLAGGVLISITILVLWGLTLRKRSRAALGLGWILIALAPALQIVPIRAYVAERFLYLPVMGLALLASQLYLRFSAGRWLLIPWVAFLIGMTAVTVPHWESDQSLWAYGVQQEPTNAFAHLCYAEDAPSLDVSEAEYKQALLNHPAPDARFSAMNNLAWLYLQEKQSRKALYWAQQAAGMEPQNPHTLYNLWKAYAGIHDSRNAEATKRRFDLATNNPSRPSGL